MDVLHPDCAGLDVHKKVVVACVLHVEAGGSMRKEIRSFGTFQPQLERLRDWLLEEGCTLAAMEATGGLLEAGVQRAGGAPGMHRGQRRAHQGSAGTQD